MHQSTYGEALDAEKFSEAEHKSVMHAVLQINGQTLMASDWVQNFGGSYKAAQGMWVCIRLNDIAQARRIFEALADGGQIAMPFDATFWSPGFGITDRFGIPWMIYVEVVS